jgi:hypothetical protein
VGRKFSFDLFRLNIVDVNDLFLSGSDHRLRGNDSIDEVFKKSCDSAFDKEQETSSAKYKWSLRYYNNYSNSLEERWFISVVLARSVLEKDGLIVTDEGISTGSSSSYPPLATGNVPSWLATGAWLYVLLRVLHSIIHCTYNRVYHRLAVFMASFGLLVAMWVSFFISLATKSAA